MNKLLCALAVLCVLGLSFLTGCDEPTEPTIPKSQLYSTISYISNPNNPYDFVGLWHNSILEDYISRVGSQAGLESDYAIMDTVYRWFIDSGTVSDKDKLADSVFLNRINPHQRIDQCGQNGYFNVNQTTFLHRVIDVIDSLTLGHDSASFMTRIAQVEAEILNQLTDTTNAAPLSAAAVARGSFLYWNHELNDPGTAWPSTFFPSSRAKIKKPTGIFDKLKAIVLADVGGAIEGAGQAAAVAIVVVVTTGGAAAPGAATGVGGAAVVGAAASSGKKAAQ